MAASQFLVTASLPPEGKYEQYNLGTRGRQLRATFPNGYGASIIIGPYSYGGPSGKYELAVMHPDQLCYSSPITNDVIGWLSPDEVVSLLHRIAALPPNDRCSHDVLPLNEESEVGHQPGIVDALSSLVGMIGSGSAQERSDERPTSHLPGNPAPR